MDKLNEWIERVEEMQEELEILLYGFKDLKREMKKESKSLNKQHD